MTRGQFGQFRHERRGMGAGQLGGIQLIQGRQPALGQPVGLGAQQRHVGDIAERVSAPEPEDLRSSRTARTGSPESEPSAPSASRVSKRSASSSSGSTRSA